MKLTDQDLAWITVAIEDRLEMLDEQRDWNESQGLMESVEKNRDEIRIYERILNKLCMRGGED
jgi:hypothetical protein